MIGHCTPTQWKVIRETARQNSVLCMEQVMHFLCHIYKNTYGIVILETMPLAIYCIGYGIIICKLCIFNVYLCINKQFRLWYDESSLMLIYGIPPSILV